MKKISILIVVVCFVSNAEAQFFQRYYNMDLITPALRDEVFNAGLKSKVNYDSLPDSTFFCSVGTSYRNRQLGTAQSSDRARFVKTAKDGSSAVFNNAFEIFDPNQNNAVLHSSANSVAEIKTTTGDGGFIMVGAVSSNDFTGAKVHGGSSALFTRINKLGNIVAAFSIDFGNTADTAWHVQRSSFKPGTFLVCGQSYDSLTRNTSCFVARFLTTGGFIWGFRYNFDNTVGNGLSAVSKARHLCEDPQTGNIYVVGTHLDRVTTANDINGLAFSLNPDGVMLWSNIYKLAPDDEFKSVKFTSDRRIIVCGHSNFGSSIAPVSNMLLLKLKLNNGQILWQTLLRATGAKRSVQFNSKAYDVVEQTTKSGTFYYTTGPAYTPNGAVQMMYKTGSTGTGINNYKYNPMKIDSLFGVDVDSTSATPGMVIFSSATNSTGGVSNSHILKTTYNGATCINACNAYLALNIAIQMVVDSIKSFRADSMSTFGLRAKKINYQTKLQCSQVAPTCTKGSRPAPLNSTMEQKGLAVFPNPANNILNISVPASVVDGAAIRILNVFGQIVWQGRITGKQQLSLEQFSRGTYLIQSDDGHTKTTLKFQKQ